LKAPTGVRAAATMTISSFICNSLGIRLDGGGLASQPSIGSEQAA
jgi:hypothetical protein